MLAEGFLLMLFTYIWRKIAERFGAETGRVIVHSTLFAISLVYACLKYWGYWDIWGQAFIQIWAIASGLYEILKTAAKVVLGES